MSVVTLMYKEGLMFHELTGDPHDSSAVQSALRLQLRQARLAKKKPTWMRLTYCICFHFILELGAALWFKNSLETFFKAILGTDLGQVCKFWGVNLAPEPLKLTSFHGQIDQ